MFSRTSRDWIVFKPETSDLIGPTTYILCDDKPLKNRVPFLSTDIRNVKADKFYTEAFYTLPDGKTQGGVSPRFTAPRSGVEECPSPGPADYDVVPDPSKDQSRPQGVGKLYLCKVPLSGRRSGPSVPTKVNENGYWLDEEGNLYKMPPDFHDTSLGPAFYRIKGESSYSYKGCKWSRRTSKRITCKIEKYPGPSDYNIAPPISFEKVKDEQLREIARKKSFLPRYLDQMECKYTRENLPGPADYNIPTKIKCNICPGIYPKPFIRGSRRFKNEINENPSPDSYDIKEFRYPVSKKIVPFSNSAPRFAQRKSYSTPGPSDYSIRSPMQEKLCQKYNEVGAVVAPFGCSTGRDLETQPKDNYCYPSPAEYHVVTKNKCKIPVSSVFKSKAKRFPIDCVKKTWCDLKKNAKKKNTEINRYTSGTGGGPPPQDISLVDEAILDLVGGTSLEGDPDVAESSASVSFIPESDEHHENKTSQEAGSAQKAIKQKKIDNALSASTNLIDQNKELIQIKKEYYQEKLRIKMEHLKIEKEKMLIERERLELEKENLKCRQQELDERKEDNLIKRRIAEILEELI